MSTLGSAFIEGALRASSPFTTTGTVKVNEQGQLIDDNGLVKRPEFLGRLVNPEGASRRDTLLDNFAMQGALEKQRLQLDRIRQGELFDTQPWSHRTTKGDFGQPEAYVMSPPLDSASFGSFNSLPKSTANNMLNLVSAPVENYEDFTSGLPTKANVLNTNLHAKERAAAIDQLINPRLNPLARMPELEANASINMGEPELRASAANLGTRALVGENQFNLANQPAIQAQALTDQANRAKISTDLTPLSIQDQVEKLKAALERNPFDFAAQNELSRLAKTEAMFTGKMQSTKFQNEFMRLLSEQNQLKTQALPAEGSPYIMRYNPETHEYESMLNPDYLNYLKKINANMGEGEGITSPSGFTIPDRRPMPALGYGEAPAKRPIKAKVEKTKMTEKARPLINKDLPYGGLVGTFRDQGKSIYDYLIANPATALRDITGVEEPLDPRPLMETSRKLLIGR